VARASTPHFALPFRFDATGHAAVVEQDSIEDVAACVEAVLRTRPGERVEHPEFGTPDPTFAQQPLGVDATVERVADWEPRAAMLAVEQRDELDEALVRVRVSLGLKE